MFERKDRPYADDKGTFIGFFELSLLLTDISHLLRPLHEAILHLRADPYCSFRLCQRTQDSLRMEERRSSGSLHTQQH